MTNNSNIREKIISQPSYWVEGINNMLYNSILDFMETNKMNRAKLAEHLGISRGRVSQILNDGEINFSIDKIVQIALKINMIPNFELINKKTYLDKSNVRRIQFDSYCQFNNDEFEEEKSETKIIHLNKTNEVKIKLAL